MQPLQAVVVQNRIWVGSFRPRASILGYEVLATTLALGKVLARFQGAAMLYGSHSRDFHGWIIMCESADLANAVYDTLTKLRAPKVQPVVLSD